MLIYWEQVTKGNGGHFVDPLKPKTSDSLNAFRFEIQEGFICIYKEKKSFLQEESRREGMDDTESQGPKIQFLHCLIKAELDLGIMQNPIWTL